ncbi:MAG: FAD-dependent oxidoreductase [Opitutales bacterium]|nr:FAD-dependent oxidoreductase [Opitutales bacterium]
MLEQARFGKWDVLVIGGGATGLGIALDSATRGLKTILVEQSDFAKSTSSRSTKLVHGGVRYLQQGDVALVREALRERGRMLRNAPHLVRDMRFIIGGYRWWERAFYTIGLTFYDLLAGSLGLGRSLPLSKSKVLSEIPSISQDKLRGGVVYHDGQFDDARMAITLALSAQDAGATCLNYLRVLELNKSHQGKVCGAKVCDELTGKNFDIDAKIVINATGVFVDDIMIMDAY